jgi:hypothetical protein
MNVLLVTFRLPGIDAAAYGRLADAAAAKIAAAPGLVSKSWLADQATDTYGGLVVFEGPAAADSCLASEVMRDLRNDPRLTEFSLNRFDTLDAAGRLTRGLRPLSVGRVAAGRSPRRPGAAARRALVWRNHGAPQVLLDEPALSEVTWEDAEWR